MNLRDHFSHSLEFFITAAAGFHDDSARYRITRVLPAVSLDLEMVK